MLSVVDSVSAKMKKKKQVGGQVKKIMAIKCEVLHKE